MSANGIEEFVGQYLTFVKNCDFVKYNEPYIAKIKCEEKRKNMGEADVIGININDKKLYICEVTAELQGMGDTNFQKYKKYEDDDENKSKNKFEKNKNVYSDKFKGFTVEYMLWFPFSPSKARMSILEKDLNEQGITAYYEESFFKAIEELKTKLSKKTENLSSPFARFFQVYGRLQKKYSANYDVQMSSVKKIIKEDKTLLKKLSQ